MNGDYIIRNNQHRGYLDGGPNHIRPFVDGTGNAGWITWRLVSTKSDYYYLKNLEHGGYLDGGPNHIRPWSDGVRNDTWISWRLIPAGDGFYIRCKQNGAYLDGSGRHIWLEDAIKKTNLNEIKWTLIPKN